MKRPIAALLAATIALAATPLAAHDLGGAPHMHGETAAPLMLGLALIVVAGGLALRRARARRQDRDDRQ